jgi:hypothetical protein
MADRALLYNSSNARYALTIWHKFEDVLNMNRKLYSVANSWSGFEYLAGEIVKIEPLMNTDMEGKSINPKYTDARKQLANR